MITFEEASKVYPDGTVAVDRLSLEVQKGELVVLIGPSGCGKTTSLKMVNRLVEPTGGSILVNGVDITRQDAVALRRSIGYVIQQVGLFPHMTVAGNISVVPELLRWPKLRRQERVDELLELVGMDPGTYRRRFPRELSGGQQQRIGVLRALAADPDIILMDEPFGALDPITREQLQDELKRLQAQVHKTILFVTHDMDEALKLGDRIVLMKDGRAVQTDTPEAMLRRPANPFVREFIGADRLLRATDEIPVQEIMNARPVTVGPGVGLAEATELMRRRKVDSLLVVADGRLQGVVRARDLVPHLLRDSDARVGRLATRDGFAVAAPQDTVRDVARRLNEEHVPFAVVVDADARLLGLVNRASLVGVLTGTVWGNNGPAAKRGEPA